MLSAFNKSTGKTEPAKTEPAAAATTTTEEETEPAVEEAKEQTEEQQATQQQDEDGYNFDEDSVVGAKDLAAKLEGIEGISDELRNELMANARIAEKNAAYSEIFGSPAEARVIAQAAQDYSAIQTTFQSITPENVKEGTSSLLNKMLELSAYRDEEGKPRRREDGTYITDGTTTRFLNELFDRKFNIAIVKKIEASGDDAAKAALDLVMERAGLRPSTADKTQVDPTLAAEKAKLDADRKQLDDQREADRRTAVKTYTDALNGDLNTLSEAEFGKLLAPATALDGLTKTAVLAKISKAVTAAIKADPAYQLEKRALQSQPMTAARRQKEVALAKRWMADKLVRVAKPILSEAGITVSKKAASRQEAQAAREKNSRGEVNGATPGATKQTPSTPQQQREQVATALKAKLGRVPTDQEINVEMMLNLPGIKNRAAA